MQARWVGVRLATQHGSPTWVIFILHPTTDQSDGQQRTSNNCIVAAVQVPAAPDSTTQEEFTSTCAALDAAVSSQTQTISKTS
jgi:hypothetical protein